LRRSAGNYGAGPIGSAFTGPGPSAAMNANAGIGNVVGAGLSSESTPEFPKGAGGVNVGGRRKGRERERESGEATLGKTRGGSPEFSRPAAIFSKSFTSPSQVTAAIGLNDDRHSLNRFAVDVNDASEES
jgi:hypothetical protein